MPHLRIKNIGPIKYADIELNKVNVIMGPQSSGKVLSIKLHVTVLGWKRKYH